MTTIGVTGATGGVGGRLARRLADAGLEQRLIVRDEARAPRLRLAEVRVAEYRDVDAAIRALDGVDVLLMVSAAESADRLEEHRAFVSAAEAAGVRHVVYTSFYAAAPDSVFTLGRDHWATEGFLRDAGFATTFLRDNLYTDFLPLLAGDDGVVRGPAGDGRLSSVTRDDVAAMAFAAVTHPDAHAGAVYDLTGPESLSLGEATQIISEVTGRRLRYENETLDEAYASRAHYGAPDWQVEAWVSTYTAIASGELAPVSDDIPRILGRPAQSLRQFLEGQAPHA
ncbi:NAD(P)-dependent oxidoreductase [Cnuibacter physcomitrellae]|uniref:NAD(P)-dependent oxidoreductase n=1 Tax=Cnuibacter physcomitrellae TaxID=1619308 RepID=A0A1X9LTX1_9MICO|nr:SDR family oxidoreductase [Cnuibacter physcomitrellae]ARJ06649.1 NAD(P)-dependent oxidoreductase [Cnuibacter physcomitrellae]GGI38507.1 NAD(P)-dependent oxidoreductase [Cnuibacter physcomitrellae]